MGFQNFQERKKRKKHRPKEALTTINFVGGCKIFGSFTGISAQVQNDIIVEIKKKQLAWCILHLPSHVVLVEHQLIFLFLLGSYVITIFSRLYLVLSFVELRT